MKAKRSNPLFANLFRGNTLATAVVVSLCGMCGSAFSQTLYWDATDAAGSGNAGGVWDSGTSWTTDSSGALTPRVAWTDGEAAVFSAGTDGTGAWTVSIIDTVTTPSILVEESGAKTISGGTINIGGGSINTAAAGNGNLFTISSLLAGSGGLAVNANGDISDSGGGVGGALLLSGANTISGDITINSGIVRSNSSFGNATNKIILNGGGIVDPNLNTNFAHDIEIPATKTGTYRTYGTVSTGQISGDITGAGTLRHTDGGTLRLSGNGSAFTGTINNARANLTVSTNDWSDTHFVNQDGSILRFNAGGTTTIKSYEGDRDVHIEAGNLLDIATGTFNVTNGAAVNGFWVQNSGSLTSSSGTLAITNGAASGLLGANTNEIRVPVIDFDGSTPLAVVKNNFNQLVLFSANTYTGGTIINGGRVQTGTATSFGTGTVTVNDGGQAYIVAAGTYANDFAINGLGVTEAAGQLGAIRFQSNTVSGGIQVASAARIAAYSGATGTHTGPLTGTANLDINSSDASVSGTVNLNGTASGYSGTLSISQGVVNINSALFGGSVLINAANPIFGRANLGAATTVSGNVTLADLGRIGGEGTILGTLTLGDTTGADIYVDATTTDVLTAETLDIKIGTENFVQIEKFPITPGAFPILKYTTLLAGDETNFVVQANDRDGNTAVVVHDTLNKQFTVNLGNASRTWDNGASTGLWNSSDANWVEGDGLFVNGDSVTFNDSPASSQTIDLPGNVAPGSISFSNSSAVSYNINGAGAITGLTGVSKTGTGTASIGGTANTYTGAVTISEGVLKTLSATALGATSTGTTVNSGTLDLNGINVGTEAVSIQGTGASGLAALYNGSTSAAGSMGALTLTADATIGGAVNTFAGAINTTGITLGSNKLTLGNGYLNVSGGDAFVGNGPVEIASNGVLFIGGNTSGGGTAPITLKSGGAISFRDYNNTALASAPAISIDGGTISNGGIDQGNGVGNGGGAQTNFKNALGVTANGGILNANNTAFGLNMIYSGVLNGTGPLQITGGRGVDFRGDVSGYSGAITVNSGQPLIFNGSAAQTFSGSIAQTGARTLSKQGANVLNLNGATINIGTFQVSTSTGTSHVAISSGNVTAGFFDLGAGAAGNYARISQTGGLVTAVAGGSGFRLGHWNTGGDGSTYALSGGTLDATPLAANAGASRVVNIGWDGLGTMTVGGGAGIATLKAYGVQLDANGDSATYNNSLILSNNGVLEIGAGNIVGASVNDGLFLNGGTLLATATTTLSAQTTLNPSTSSFIDTDAFAVAWSGPITGSGSFEKSGVAPLTMTAGGAFSGAATASEGRLYTGTTAWTDATFASITDGILQPATSGAAGTSTLKNLTLDGGSAAFRAKVTGGDQFNVTGSLTVESASTLVVDTSTMTIGQQAVLIDYQGSIAGAAGYDGLTIVPLNPRAQIDKVHNVGDTQILASLASVDSVVWSGSINSNWDLNSTSNWVLASNNSTAANFLEFDVARFTNFGVATRPNVTLVGTINPSLVEVSNTTGTYEFSGAAITGSGGLTKTGSGGLVLAASNSYSGVTSIGGGSVTASAANALGTGATTLNSGTLNLNHASALGSGVLTIAGGALGNTSGSPITLATNNAQSWTGDFVCTAAHPLNLGTGAVTLSATRQVLVTSADLTVGGVISGTGFGITKAGSGKLVLAGANNYTGVTTVDAGTLEVTANAGAKSYTVAPDATLRLGYSTGNADYGYGITVNGSGVASTSGLYIEGGDSLVLTNSLTLATAPTTVRAYGTGTGTLRGWDVNFTNLNVQAAASSSIIDSGVTLNGSGYGYRMSVTAGSETATGDLVIDGPMTGSANAGFANFRKHGSGSVRINSVATYAAGLDIRGGSVILGGSDRLPLASYVALGEGTTSGVLKLNGNSQTLASISTTGTGTANAIVGASSTVSTLTISNSAAVTFAGSLGGPGSDENNLNLVKQGPESLTLSGVNTHTGDTTVNEGTLTLAASGRLSFELGAISGSSNLLSGAGTVALDGDFAIDTSAADALTSGTWVLENVPSLGSAYGITFQALNPDGSPWTDAGSEKWTKPGVNPGQTWTFDELTGSVTLTTSAGGYDSWKTQIADVNQRDREDDPDTDGFTNQQEFLFGTDPTTGTGSLTTTERSGADLIIRWRERTPGTGYTLLESATLTNPWNPSAAPITTDGALDGDYQPVKATITIGAGSNFFRVEGVEN